MIQRIRSTRRLVLPSAFISLSFFSFEIFSTFPLIFLTYVSSRGVTVKDHSSWALSFSPSGDPWGGKSCSFQTDIAVALRRKKRWMKGRENSKKSMPFNVFFSFIKDELQPICLPSENMSQSDTVWTPTDYSSSALIKESQELFSPFNVLLQLIPIDWEGQKMGM